MAKTTRSEKSGTAFTDIQRATDQAINVRNLEEGTDPNDPKNRARVADTAQKKTGGGSRRIPACNIV